MTSGRTSSHSTASGSVWLGRLIGTAVLHMAEAWAPHASGVSHKKKKNPFQSLVVDAEHQLSTVGALLALGQIPSKQNPNTTLSLRKHMAKMSQV